MKVRLTQDTIAKAIPCYNDPLSTKVRFNATAIKLRARHVFDTCLLQTKYSVLVFNDRHDTYYWVNKDMVELFDNAGRKIA